ncbi:MAG: ChaN family lipoprotein [Lautropia sp.]|nr:ChaN family lipoprotein [Lautropia sp.]
MLWGEQHDQSVHHLLRARWLTDWSRMLPDGTGSAAIVFEHLDREHDAALTAARQRQPDGPLEDWLTEALFDGKRWGEVAYRPLFVAAEQSGLTWVAANLSRRSAQQWMKGTGKDQPAVDTADWLRQRLPASAEPADAWWHALLRTADWDAEAEAQLLDAVRTGHCDALPEPMLVPMAAAQRLRDAALADGMWRGIGGVERPSAERSILPPRLLLAGNAHVDRRFGVPRYLGVDQQQVLVLGMFPLSALTSAPGQGQGDETHGHEGARVAQRGKRLADWVGEEKASRLAAAYDVVVLTPVASGGEPPDHCAIFRPSS